SRAARWRRPDLPPARRLSGRMAVTSSVRVFQALGTRGRQCVGDADLPQPAAPVTATHRRCGASQEEESRDLAILDQRADVEWQQGCRWTTEQVPHRFTEHTFPLMPGEQ